MKTYTHRLNRLEKESGAGDPVRYVILFGFRSVEHCISSGRPCFRAPGETRFRHIQGIIEMRGTKMTDSFMNMKAKEAQEILKAMGYEQMEGDRHA